MRKNIWLALLLLMATTLSAQSWTYRGLRYETISKRQHTAMLVPQDDKVIRNSKVIEVPRVVWHKGWSYRVTTIGKSALGGSWLLLYVSLPESVKRVEAGAMAWCINLETVEIPETVEYIDETAFDNSPKVKVVVRTKKK